MVWASVFIRAYSSGLSVLPEIAVAVVLSHNAPRPGLRRIVSRYANLGLLDVGSRGSSIEMVYIYLYRFPLHLNFLCSNFGVLREFYLPNPITLRIIHELLAK